MDTYVKGIVMVDKDGNLIRVEDRILDGFFYGMEEFKKKLRGMHYFYFTGVPPCGKYYLPANEWRLSINFSSDTLIRYKDKITNYCKEEVNNWRNNHVFFVGKHTINNDVAVVYNNVEICATGKSKVVANGNSLVISKDKTFVTLFDNSAVTALDNSEIVAWDNSTVVAKDNTVAYLHSESFGFFSGVSRGFLHGVGEVRAEQNSVIQTYDCYKNITVSGNAKVIKSEW